MSRNWMNRLESYRGAHIVTAIASTEARLAAAGTAKFGRVRKISRYNGVVNFDYERALRKALDTTEPVETSESTYEIETHSDGKMKPFCRNKKDPSKRYLRMKLQKKIDSVYLDEKGRVIDYSDIESYLRSSSDRLVPIITINTDNILEVNG